MSPKTNAKSHGMVGCEIYDRAPVLIANRGEIAIRIARTCGRLGFPTVAVYSEADHFAEHVRTCDRAILIGGPEAKDSYLNVSRVIEAAKISGAKYVHPGYGFLSERAHFVEACEKAGLIFVGPSAESMRQMGDKIKARKLIDELKVPRVPGSAGAVSEAKEARQVADSIGYPVLFKAAAGGGGKGMRRVNGASEVEAAFDGATREASAAFGDGSLYVEKLILEPHHVEIQVFGDGKGKAIHLGERECSIQRRHQKIWEESPSPILNKFPNTREAMFASAIKIAEHVRYAGAGTLEFIVDGSGNYYFLEMNTRLQVEHPVTEWVTGVDLVAWQLLLATGEFINPAINPERRGSAIEVRLYAEDPHHFLPAPGPLGMIKLPGGAFVRSDSAFTEHGEISRYYDPMIAKISVWAPSRAEAIGRLRIALDETQVEPEKKYDGSALGSLKTNLSFLRRLVRNKMVIEGDTATDLIEKNPSLVAQTSYDPPLEAALAVTICQLLHEGSHEGSMNEMKHHGSPVQSNWAKIARWEGLR